MFFGIDAMNSLGQGNQHGYTNYQGIDVNFASGNIASAMKEDSIWGEDIEIKQAVQDQFELIGKVPVYKERPTGAYPESSTVLYSKKKVKDIRYK